MNNLDELNNKIKALKNAKDILQYEYSQSDFHKKKEANPHSISSPKPQDKEILKLLTAIQQLENYIKKYQDQQFFLLKQHNNK